MTITWFISIGEGYGGNRKPTQDFWRLE